MEASCNNNVRLEKKFLDRVTNLAVYRIFLGFPGRQDQMNTFYEK